MLRVALRVALLSSAIVLVLFSILGFLFLTDASVLLIALASAAIVFLVVYTTVVLLLKKRLTRILEELDDLNQKRFFDHEPREYSDDDEIDDILRRLDETSFTIEKEFYRLKRMENYRKDFIGDLSHELKTPIFAIQGFVETLINGALEDPEVNREFLKKAMRNVSRLISLTNNLMEIAKLETGELKTLLSEIPLKSVILEVVENLQFKAEHEQVNIIVDDMDTDLLVMADRNQIRQVLINLIENAIKYNKPDGSVHVGTFMAPNQGNKKITVYVRDTGIGIEAKHIPRITERFYRTDKSRARDKGGTGLGLAIVKHIIEAHNEQLSIESEPNKGTTFSFTLQNAALISG
jgi:two-component system phosphate regulon sensor histidine kinase PhoR